MLASHAQAFLMDSTTLRSTTLRLALPTVQACTFAAKRKEDTVSLCCSRSGETFTIIKALESPPRESLSNVVRREFRYGTWQEAPRPRRARASTTSPSAERDLLMCCASRSRSPMTPDFSTRSEPARSTKERRPSSSRAWPSTSQLPSKESWNIMWDLLERSFEAVAAVCLSRVARRSRLWTATASFTTTRLPSSVRPSVGRRSAPEPGRRSQTASLYTSTKVTCTSKDQPRSRILETSSKTRSTARGIMPAPLPTALLNAAGVAGAVGAPSMVYVLPLPVWP
mmetsp:Transcript_8339/g.18218  ORF Transcript_8339/g.18218 Transcript_8339/m.18218 type:complete len:283 (+) Transcript_8339:28-876(+)